MPLSDLQQLLTELHGLEITSFNVDANDEGREADASELLPADDEFNPFRQCLDHEMKSLLAKALSELPEREKQVLILYYYEGTHDERSRRGAGGGRVADLSDSLSRRDASSFPATTGRPSHAGECET